MAALAHTLSILYLLSVILCGVVVHGSVALWQLAHLHGAVRAAREQTSGTVYVNLRNSLADVFKE